MKGANVVLVFTLCCSASTPAQTVPDFSGRWTLDFSKSGMMRVGDAGTARPTVQPPTRIKHVDPIHPYSRSSAWAVAGSVAIEATIDKLGGVADAEVIMSVPALDRAALEAVRQWKYTPALVNNAPVPVTMTVIVSFSLTGIEPSRAKPTGAAVRRWLSADKVAITQDAASLTLASDGPKGPQVTMYFLNGADVTNAFLAFVPPAPDYMTAEFRSRSYWEGTQLVTVIKPDLTETRYLDGETMVVEMVTTSAKDGKPKVSKLVYKKVG